MPLIKGRSNKSFSHNVKAEMDAGKPQKQSLAIAYSMKRKAKKMAMGGDPDMTEDSPVESDLMDHKKMANETEAENHDLVDSIMKKRGYSEGGMIANEQEQITDDMPNNFDDLSLRDDLESSYGDDDNSGDSLGNEQLSEDEHDMISRIMRSRAKKDRLPNPR